jgi:hypothetical protein
LRARSNCLVAYRQLSWLINCLPGMFTVCFCCWLFVAWRLVPGKPFEKELRVFAPCAARAHRYLRGQCRSAHRAKSSSKSGKLVFIRHVMRRTLRRFAKFLNQFVPSTGHLPLAAETLLVASACASRRRVNALRPELRFRISTDVSADCSRQGRWTASYEHGSRRDKNKCRRPNGCNFHFGR